jgi:hypothetical protein
MIKKLPCRGYDSMAEVVGFEPTMLSHDSFQDCCHKPLGDTSTQYNQHILANCQHQNHH